MNCDIDFGIEVFKDMNDVDHNYQRDKVKEDKLLKKWKMLD